MGRGGVVCAVLAMFSLTAAKCTPEQIAAVERDYRNSVEGRPSITVTADCETFTVHAEGWPAESSISMTIEAEPGWQLTPVDGVADGAMDVWAGYGRYYWSVGGLLHLATDPTVVQSGTVDCGPGEF